ncbi:MAG TPA: hypothetical protein ENN17_03045 [bacterium]|nr:hypothetical protein [bacterium]
MFRIENIRTAIDTPQSDLRALVCGMLRIPPSRLDRCVLVRKAVDARKKNAIQFVYTVDVSFKHERVFLKSYRPPGHLRIKSFTPFKFQIAGTGKSLLHPPVVAGAGPCGLFAGLILARAGLAPVVIERGKPVKDRIRDVEAFLQHGTLDPESNIQFGEGGAGTFSDGKLYTLINDPRTHFIFHSLIEAGAPPEIAYDARPHIGTDRLRDVVRNLRQMIINAGGTVRFGARLTDLDIRDGALYAIRINGEEIFRTDRLILATGHSARDTVSMLFERGVPMTQKSFSVGVRIEHKRIRIDRAQYGRNAGHPNLPAGKYKLSALLENGRGVYTFCMCPGGFVIPAASEPGCLATNGMSEYAQDQVNSNSALLVGVHPSDFGSDHPLAGIEFQRRWERLAFALGGGTYAAPVQKAGDFLQDRISDSAGEVIPSYRPGTFFAPLRDCLPDFVTDSLKAGIRLFGRKLEGFTHPDAILTGVETRSSAPFRIQRDDNMESAVYGLFPAGEGAGHAGGIVSAAVDGIKAAEAAIQGPGNPP